MKTKIGWWTAIKMLFGWKPKPEPAKAVYPVVAPPKKALKQELAEVRRERRNGKRLTDAAAGGWWRPGRARSYGRPLCR